MSNEETHYYRQVTGGLPVATNQSLHPPMPNTTPEILLQYAVVLDHSFLRPYEGVWRGKKESGKSNRVMPARGTHTYTDSKLSSRGFLKMDMDQIPASRKCFSLWHLCPFFMTCGITSVSMLESSRCNHRCGLAPGSMIVTETKAMKKTMMGHNPGFPTWGSHQTRGEVVQVYFSGV